MKWTKNKPKQFREDCLLLTASWHGYWNYSLFQIRKTEAYDDGDKLFWYWGIFQDGDEWGDYGDLVADKYCILPALKNKKK